MPTPVRLLTVRVLLMLLGAAFALLALSVAVSPAGPGHHGGSYQSGGKVSPNNKTWN